MSAILIVGVGILAGFVDAIAGGGGLIMLPGLLFSGLPVGSAIATNKLCGTFGALTSSLKFAQAKQVDKRTCLLMSVPVILGAYAGSRSIGRLPTALAEPVVIVLMIGITLIVVLKPELGAQERESTPAVSKGVATAVTAGATSNPMPRAPAFRDRKWKRPIGSVVAGGAIGFHDGFFGPGTGVFLVFTLLSLRALNFLRATGTTKVLNFLANVTALITFTFSGNIDYSKGVYGALGVATGSFLGASFATKRGAKLIKPIFVCVTLALTAKLLLNR